jgi:hypothetical protein
LQVQLVPRDQRGQLALLHRLLVRLDLRGLKVQMDLLDLPALPELMVQRGILGLLVQLEPLARLSRGQLVQRDLPDHLAPPAPLVLLDHKARLARLGLLDLQVLPELMGLLAPREPMAPTARLAPQAAMGLTVRLAQRVRKEHLDLRDQPDLQVLLRLLQAQPARLAPPETPQQLLAPLALQAQLELILP